jgi:hypothetical protein
MKATYLQGLTSQGVKLSDVTKITVDGHPATLMSVAADQGFDGDLGCPKADADQAWAASEFSLNSLPGSQ